MQATQARYELGTTLRVIEEPSAWGEVQELRRSTSGEVEYYVFDPTTGRAEWWPESALGTETELDALLRARSLVAAYDADEPAASA